MLRPIALYAMILISGFYAGLHFTGMMNPSIFGIINTKGDRMTATAWAATWQITDGFMRVRMEVFGPIVLWGYVITILLFIKSWKSIPFWLLVVACGVFITDLVLTINRQIPINRYIEKLDLQRLTPEQTKMLAQIHPQVINNFQGREWLAILGFVLVALTPFLVKKPNSPNLWK